MSMLRNCLLLFSLFSMAACQSTTAADDILTNQQTLRLTIPHEIWRLDASLAVDANETLILNQVAEGLMRLDQNNRPIPALAEKVNVSADQTVYTFQLRNAVWQDGEPVTAYDFARAWKRTLHPKTDSPNAYLFYPIVNAQSYHRGEVSADKVGITVVDEETLQVRLSQPTRNFLTLLALTPFLPQRDSFTQPPSANRSTLLNLKHNGPFVILDVSADGTIVLKKNEQYWDQEQVKLDYIIFYVSNHPTRTINLYNADKIDITRIAREFAQAYANTPEFHSIQLWTTQYIRFNSKNKFFQNEKIRQAISLAIDREQLVSVLKSQAQPAGGLIPPSMKGFRSAFREEAPLPPDKANSGQARTLLQEGMQELRISQPPSALVMLSYEDDRMQLAVELKKQLKQALGLNLLLNTTSRAEKYRLEKWGEFDLTLSDWATTYPDAYTLLETFTSDHPANTGGYKDKPYDETLKRAAHSPQVQKQVKYLAQAEKFLIVEDHAAIPLYYVNDTILIKQRVKGHVHHPFGAPYSFKWTYIEKP
ncbi:ABC transporter substrate-binding protein [Laceyella tengchongensis]